MEESCHVTVCGGAREEMWMTDHNIVELPCGFGPFGPGSLARAVSLTVSRPPSVHRPDHLLAGSRQWPHPGLGWIGAEVNPVQRSDGARKGLQSDGRRPSPG